MPSVTHLDIAPVMSLGLERRDQVVVTERGVPEDRRFLIVDDAGRLIDQLLVADMVQIRAWTDADAAVLRLTFPDGQVVEDEVGDGPVFEGVIRRVPTQGHDIQGPWAEPLSAFMGRSVRVIRTDQPGVLQKDGRLSMVTDASLDKLSHHLGTGAVDGRRFRMLINLAGDIAHEEDTWIGHRVGLGDVTLRVTGAIPRCAITTHDPDSGDRDFDTLRAIQGVPRADRPRRQGPDVRRLR